MRASTKNGERIKKLTPRHKNEKWIEKTITSHWAKRIQVLFSRTFGRRWVICVSHERRSLDLLVDPSQKVKGIYEIGIRRFFVGVVISQPPPNVCFLFQPLSYKVRLWSTGTFDLFRILFSRSRFCKPSKVK